MGKISKLIDKIRWKKENQWVSYKISKNKKETKLDLTDTLKLTKEEWLDTTQKNEFWLKLKDVDVQLEKIFAWNGIGDGSFLYEWSTPKANGIEKYQKAVTTNEIYKEIKLTEEHQFQSILSEKAIQYAYTILNKAKAIVELWSGGVSKLLDSLKFMCWSEEQLQSFLKDKKIKLLDVAAAWYTWIKNQLNDVVEEISEGIEGNMIDASSLAYTADQPCYFMFGGTIGNFNREEIQWILENMKSKEAFKSSYVFITYFTAPDKNKLSKEEYDAEVSKLEAMYGGWDKRYVDWDDATDDAINKLIAMKEFILSWFEALGIPRYATDEHNKKISQMEYVVTYEEARGDTPARIKVGAKLLRDIEVKTQTGKVFTKRAGEHIRAIQSSRFTEEEFVELAKKSWYNVPIKVNGDWVGVAVLQSKIWFNDKYRKIRNILWWVLIWATLLGWWYATKNILHQKEVFEKQEKVDKDFTNKQKIFFYGNHSYYELNTDNEKIEYIDKLKDEIYENISVRYNVHKSEDEIKKIIRSYIQDKEILGRFANTSYHAYNIFQASNDFVKKFNNILIEQDINKMPYDHLNEFETYFKDVILESNIMNKKMVHFSGDQNFSGDQGTIGLKYIYIPDPLNGATTYNSSIDLECFENWIINILRDQQTIPVENENDPRISNFLNQRTDVESHYIKNGYLYIKTWKKERYNYVKASAHGYDEKKVIDPTIIAYDYFYQNRPIIHEIYKRFGAIYRNMSWNSDREKGQTLRWEKDSIKMLITKDLLKTGFLDILAVDNDIWIITYLQGFTKRNALALKKEWISIVPYASYQKWHGEAFENTQNADGKDIPNIIEYDKRKEEYKFKYLWKYYTQKGVEYDLAEMIISWKKYLYARNIIEDNDKYHVEEWMDIPILNYYLSRGKEVVQDYLDLQKKF